MNTPQNSTELDLIRWPSYESYRDTGEGGLFAYALWPLEAFERIIVGEKSPEIIRLRATERSP